MKSKEINVLQGHVTLDHLTELPKKAIRIFLSSTFTGTHTNARMGYSYLKASCGNKPSGRSDFSRKAGLLETNLGRIRLHPAEVGTENIVTPLYILTNCILISCVFKQQGIRLKSLL